MAESCCDVQPIEQRQRKVLTIVLWINLAMFATEFGAGVLAHSTALLADAADMFGDAIVYGFSLYVVGRGPQWQRRGAVLKGSIMAAFALGIVIEVAIKLARGVIPDGEVIGLVGVVALAANASVLAFLWRHRADDLNMQSAWLCSRNDVIANAALLIAAVAVSLFQSAWPDIVTGLAIASLFGSSALGILRRAIRRDMMPASTPADYQPS